ncbi:MAG: carbohydrate kinase family protein [Gaiellaceae bacterium]
MDVVSKPVSAVVAGHICLDVIPTLAPSTEESFREAFRPGRLIEAGVALLSPGGLVSNAGLALHALGIPTTLAAKVGDDPFGDIVRELVESHGSGLSAGLKVDGESSTPYTLIVSPPGVDRLFLHHPGAAGSFGAEDIDFALLERSTLFHFGYPPLMRRMYRNGGRGLVDLFERARATGVTTSLDMSYPDPASESGHVDWREILEAVLPFVDVFSPSLDELLFMLRRPLFEQLSRQRLAPDPSEPALLHELGEELAELGVGIAAIKLGERGLYLKTGTPERIAALGRARPSDPADWAGRELWAPCFEVEVAGTTGAGDATVAGLLTALLRGLDAESAVTAAVAVGACDVERTDALSGLRSWEETLARMRSDWRRLPLELDDPAWSWKPAKQLWMRIPETRSAR